LSLDQPYRYIDRNTDWSCIFLQIWYGQFRKGDSIPRPDDVKKSVLVLASNRCDYTWPSCQLWDLSQLPKDVEQEITRILQH
jgi:hypothetical protein